MDTLWHFLRKQQEKTSKMLQTIGLNRKECPVIFRPTANYHAPTLLGRVFKIDIKSIAAFYIDTNL